MNDYEQKCLDADKELAGLLGWHRIASSKSFDGFVELRGDNPSKNLIDSKISRYTLDSASSFRLMVEYGKSPVIGSTGVVVDNAGSIIWYKDFPDRYSCVRFAIVQATINKLKGD